MGIFGGLEDLVMDLLLAAAKQYGRDQQKQMMAYLSKRGWVTPQGGITVAPEKLPRFLKDCFGAVVAALKHGGA